MRERGESATFEVRTSVMVQGQFLLTFRCDSCGNEGGVISGNSNLALYCTGCVYEDNVKQRLELKPIRAEIRSD